MKNAVICFLKYPKNGEVKTRLAKDIGDDNATEFYTKTAEKIIEQAKKINADLFIFFYPPHKLQKFQDWLGTDLKYLPQIDGDLGKKMADAFLEIFAKDYDKTIIIGTDIPDIDTEILDKSFVALDKKDCVIGPSPDGGYYLLGFNKNSFFIEIFQDIEYSTNVVFEKTISKLKKFGKTYLTLESLEDVDDLESYNRYINRGK